MYILPVVVRNSAHSKDIFIVHTYMNVLYMYRFFKFLMVQGVPGIHVMSMCSICGTMYVVRIYCRL